MRVGVTGSSGLIGTALCDALDARGDAVVRFVRSDARGVPARRRPGAVIRWNPALGQIDDLDLPALDGLDAIVNLAGVGIGERRWTPQRREAILQSRVDATNLVMTLAARHGVAMVVNASAIGYYGSRGDEILTEESGPGSGFLAEVCQAWERAARAEGVKTAHLRTGIVMTRSGGALARQLPIFRAGLGGVLGDGEQWLSPVSLVDEVRAVLWVIDRQLEGPVNLVAPCPLTNRDFTRALARALRRPAFARVPRVALEAALGREAARELVLTSQRVTPEALSRDGFPFAHATISAILTSALSPEAASFTG